MKKGLLIVGGLVVTYGLAYWFYPCPKGVININDSTKTGTWTFGKKSGSFSPQSVSGTLKTWNGYEMDIAPSNTDSSKLAYFISRYGKMIETNDITPEITGTNNVTINHTS